MCEHFVDSKSSAIFVLVSLAVDIWPPGNLNITFLLVAFFYCAWFKPG